MHLYAALKLYSFFVHYDSFTGDRSHNNQFNHYKAGFGTTLKPRCRASPSNGRTKQDQTQEVLGPRWNPVNNRKDQLHTVVCVHCMIKH